MTSVSKEMAEAEVQAWLDKKKIFEDQKEQNRDSFDILVSAVMNGVITLDQTDWKFTHKLLFPFGEGEKVNTLTYKHRLNEKMLKPYQVGLSPKDGDGRFLAYVAALTEQPRAILENLDTADKKIANAIAIFFL